MTCAMGISPFWGIQFREAMVKGPVLRLRVSVPFILKLIFWDSSCQGTSHHIKKGRSKRFQ